MSTRTTIYLDETLLERTRKFVPPRGLSQLISELLAVRVAEFERQQLEAELREGYSLTKADREALNHDWGITDTEGWPA